MARGSLPASHRGLGPFVLERSLRLFLVMVHCPRHRIYRLSTVERRLALPRCCYCAATLLPVSRTFSFPKRDLRISFPLTPTLWQPPSTLEETWTWWLWGPHVGRLSEDLCSCVSLVSLSTMSSDLIRAVACVRVSFLLQLNNTHRLWRPSLASLSP